MYRTDKQFMKNPATASSRIYIGALPKTVVADDLETKFKVHGTILGLVLQSGFAFIQYQNDFEAQSAIKNEHGTLLHGRKINVKQALEKNKPMGNNNAQQFQQGMINKQPPQHMMQQQQQQQQQQQPPPLMQQPQQPPKPSNFPPQTQKTQNYPPAPEIPTPGPPTISKPQQEAPKMQTPVPEQDEDNNGPPEDEIENDRPNIRPPVPSMHPPAPEGEERRQNMRGGLPPLRGRMNDRPFDRPPRDMYRNTNNMHPYYGRENYAPPAPPYGPPPPIADAPPPDRNDCEIIVVSKPLTEYAEYIEQQLKQIGLIVDLLFPNEDVPIGKVLANISSRGCLYAILVMPQNEEHRSLTLNVLHGIPQEHRNMPVEDAMILISRNFEAYMRGEQSTPENGGQMTVADRHPPSIQMMLNLLAENRQLTTPQYDKLLKYLQERREIQCQHEIDEGIEQDSQDTGSNKQTELQNRIMNILNKSADTPVIPASITAPDPPPAAPTPLLKDPSVQKALDSLLLGDMFKNMSGV